MATFDTARLPLRETSYSVSAESMPKASLTTPQPLQGDLQSQVMAVMWRLGAGTVEQVRAALPTRYQGAYTTVQTVLNRLAERGLLTRQRNRNVIEYRPAISEADHVAQSIAQRLEAASTDARQTALARLIGGLSESELSTLRELARRRGA